MTNLSNHLWMICSACFGMGLRADGCDCERCAGIGFVPLAAGDSAVHPKPPWAEGTDRVLPSAA